MAVLLTIAILGLQVVTCNSLVVSPEKQLVSCRLGTLDEPSSLCQSLLSYLLTTALMRFLHYMWKNSHTNFDLMEYPYVVDLMPIL